MQIFFYKNCNFRLDAYVRYDSDSIIEFFDKNHLNPDEYIISDRNGKEYKYDYDLKDDVYVVYPKIAKGSKGKGWLGVVLGIATILTAGATSGLLGLTVGATKMLGVGMLLSGAGTFVMGQMKMPSMDFNTESATKQNYQWNVGNLSTSRGVKGVTFGNNVTPEGELLAYRTYGTSNITSQDSYKRYFYGKSKEITQAQYNQGKRTNNGLQYLYRYETVNAYADSDNDGTSWLEMLIGCGEGELDSITNIKINDTPIENIIDVNDESTGRYITRLGSNNQTSLPDTDIDNQIGIMSVSQVMPQKLAGSDNPLIVTTFHACDSILIACQSSVVYKMDTQSGAKNRCFLKPRIGYRLSGSTGAYTYVKTGIKEFDNDIPFKAESAFYFDVAVKFPTTGVYEISLQNLSAEKCVEKGIINPLPAVLPDSLQCAISIDNITLYSNKSQCYPGTALIYLRLPASQALNGSMPRITWKQSRANCYVWNGSSYVTKPLNNLAWAIYDILAQVRKDNYDNSYHNEGEDVANIDYAKFSLFADFCSNLNIKGSWFLNKLDSAWSTAMSVATSARAFIGTRNGKICPYWDSATEMTQIFTVGNYENMSGWLSAKKSRARAIEATFNDENDSFRSKTIRVEIDDFAADAEAVGVNYVALSTAESVYKAAHYQLRRNKYLCQTVKFTANLDALVCELYDVIGVQCDITKFGVGGRIYAVNGNSISLDAPVTLSGGNYALLVAHDNGTIERMSITEHTGTLTTVTVSGYVRTPKVNEVYSLGVVNNEVKKFRVTSIVKTSDLKCEIEAVEYQPQLYVEGVAPDISYTNPNANISNISTTYNPEGVDIAWHKDVNTAYVDVYVDGVYYGRFAEGATIPNVNSTQQIECVPVNMFGTEGIGVTADISNNLPTPPLPSPPLIIRSSVSVILTFPVPANNYICWLVIREGFNELGRAVVNGDDVTIDIPLGGGNHTLSAYFLNTYGRSSLAYNFDTNPLGIDNTLLQAYCVKATNIEAEAVTTEKLDAGAVTTEKLDAGAVTAEKIDVDDLSALNAKIGGNIITEDGIHSEGYTSGLNGWSINKYGDADFNDVSIRGTLKSVNFEKDTVSTVGGQLMVNASAELQSYSRLTINNQVLQSEDWLELLTEDNQNLFLEQSGQTVYYTITVDDASVLNVKDILRIRNADTVTDLWLVVLSKNDNTLVCSMLYGSAMDLSSGMTVVNYGKAGTGGIILDGNAPRMDMFTHDGEPWQRINNHLRMGNLNGFLDYTENQYGIAIGNLNAYLKYDPVNSLRIKGNIESTYLTANSENVILGTSANPWMLVNSAGATFSGNIRITDNNIQGRNFIEAHGEYANSATDYVISDFGVTRGSVVLEQKHYSDSARTTLTSSSRTSISPTVILAQTQKNGKNITFSAIDGTINCNDENGAFYFRSNGINSETFAGGSFSITPDGGFSHRKDNSNYAGLSHNGISFGNTLGNVYISNEAIQLRQGNKLLFQYSSDGSIYIAKTANNDNISIGMGGIGATVGGVYRFKTWAQILG